MANEIARRVIWEKWVNPLTGAGSDNDISFEDEEEDERPYKDSSEEFEKQLKQLRKPPMYQPSMGRVIAGPLGYMPIDEHGDPAVVYDFWMMHTNFNINEAVATLVKVVDGVESWNVHTRYRARVGFARLFNRAEVMRVIQETLGCGDKTVLVKEPDCRNTTIERLKKKLSSLSPSWAILNYDDGQFRTIRGDEDHVRKNVENIKALPNPPKIIVSWEK